MLFSVITVTRNNLKGLQSTEDSLHVQTCRDFEWIVIDGSSADGTVKHLASRSPLTLPSPRGGEGYEGLASAYPQSGEGGGLRWISGPDNGIYDAMNKGIAMAQGDYLLFLNAGDTLAAPGTLDKIKAKLGNNQPDFIYGDSIEAERIKKARSHKKILTGMVTHHQAMLYKRSAVGASRYDQAYKIAADYKFTLEHLIKGQAPLYCPFPLCIYEQGGISQRQVRRGRIEQFKIRKELKACSLPVNAGIYIAQTLVMTLRRHSPWLYWKVIRIFYRGPTPEN